MNIVLLQPEIPHNTGNIGRTCVVTGSVLHLIGPLGFSLEDRYVKRAGMDYWKDVEYYVYDSFEHFLMLHPEAERKLVLATTKAQRLYTEMKYEEDSWLMFGKESKGIPEELLVRYEEQCCRIPMIHDRRSLNLSNSVAVVVYEALRQLGFPSMQRYGNLHTLHWKNGDDSIVSP